MKLVKLLCKAVRKFSSRHSSQKAGIFVIFFFCLLWGGFRNLFFLVFRRCVQLFWFLLSRLYSPSLSPRRFRWRWKLCSRHFDSLWAVRLVTLKKIAARALYQIDEYERTFSFSFCCCRWIACGMKPRHSRSWRERGAKREESGGGVNGQTPSWWRLKLNLDTSKQGDEK